MAQDTEAGSYLQSPVVRAAFPIFKYGIYLLLAINIYLFVVHGSRAEVLDQLGWVMLLGTMEYETRSLDQDYDNRFQKYLVLALKIAAYAIIVHAWYSYGADGEWLDFVNASTWLVVCAALEYDVYFPGEFDDAEWKLRNILKCVLYAILIGCAVMWGIDGNVLRFYDAFLWILAFFVIELNVFGFETAQEESAGAVSAE